MRSRGIPEKLQDEGRLLEENVRRVLTGFGRVDETNPDFTLSHSGDGILMVEVHSASGLKKELAFGIQNILHGLKNLWCVVLKPQIEPACLGRHFDVEIYANRVEEFWDIKYLREQLGAQFKW